MKAVREAGGTMQSSSRAISPTAMPVLVDFAVNTYGRIDVLFNNAEGRVLQLIEDIPMRSGIVTGVTKSIFLLLTRAAWPHLKARHA